MRISTLSTVEIPTEITETSKTLRYIYLFIYLFIYL